MKNLAVFFPGIGYTNDKPLLYYTRKFLQKSGFEIININYSGFPEKILGDKKKISLSEEIAFEQSEICLESDDFSAFSKIVFVSKSIGTFAAAKIASSKNLDVSHVFFTPLKETFDFNQKNAIVFHGTSDTWIKNEKLSEICGKQKIPLYLYENANHSLETGDIFADIALLKDVMKKVQNFVCN